jgi:hypothetical protein
MGTDTLINISSAAIGGQPVLSLEESDTIRSEKSRG